MVYSCNSLVKFAFTVHGKDHADSSSSRSVFLGQCLINVNQILQKSFFSGKFIKCHGKLREMEIEPRDQKFMNKSDDSLNFRGRKCFGKIAFEIHPLTNVESKCGILEEIVSTVLKGARKKWYAVLADKQLFLFSQYGDSRPKVVIPIQNGVRIGWFDKHRNVIKLNDLNNKTTWLLTCGNKQHLLAWYNKMTGLYKRTLQNGATFYKGVN